MSRIRSRGTVPERRVQKTLDRMLLAYVDHPKIYGNPDFLVGGTALFVDGCFWHCCPEHFRLPKANRGFWKRKFRRNRRRDLEVNERLAMERYRVVRIWEHETKDGLLCEKLEELLHEKIDV